MEIILLIMMVCVIGSQYYLLKSLKEKPVREEPKVKEKPKPVKLTKEQKERQEQLRQSFENLMKYDYNEALKKKE